MASEITKMPPKGFKLLANALNLEENSTVDFALGVSDDEVSNNSDSSLRVIENKNHEGKSSSIGSCSKKRPLRNKSKCKRVSEKRAITDKLNITTNDEKSDIC